jgi:predicted metalloprotease with PDZ domain
MTRRIYLIISLVAALGVAATLAQTSLAQKEKSKEKEKLGSDTNTFALEGPGAFSQSILIREGGYLGVYLEEVTASRMKDLGVTEERGAIVMKVAENGPAEKAGLKENDVIISFNGRRVDSVRELQRLLSETPPGRTVSVEFIRAGNRQTASVLLSDRVQRGPAIELGKLENFSLKDIPIPEIGNFTFGDFTMFRGRRLGIAAESLTDQLGDYFGVKDGKGVLITQVFEDSPAARAGLKAGDVIVAIDNEPVENMRALTAAIDRKGEGQVAVKVMRNRSEQTINVTIEKAEGDNIKRMRALPRKRAVRSI